MIEKQCTIKQEARQFEGHKPSEWESSRHSVTCSLRLHDELSGGQARQLRTRPAAGRGLTQEVIPEAEVGVRGQRWGPGREGKATLHVVAEMWLRQTGCCVITFQCLFCPG